MLNGFANENMGRNRFMARTRQLNNSFSNAIGTKEVTPLPDIYKDVRKAPLNQVYANALGTTTYVKPSPTDPNKYIPRCSGDGSSYICMDCPAFGGANCPTEEGGYRASSQAGYEFLSGCGCTYGGINNPYGNNPKVVQNVSVKFDGGFANAYGNPVQRASRPLVYNPYKNASGGCGCGCNGDALLGL